MKFQFLAAVIFGGALMINLFTAPTVVYAQEQESTRSAEMAGMPGMGGPGATNDLFVMLGSDFDRPGLVPRANYSIGIGHMFDFLKKDFFGDELTFGYMYENSGTHGFLHTAFGEHTESVGLMKNFPLPATKRLTGYTWIQTGITTYTGNPRLQNRLDSSLSLGAIIHFTRHSSVWIQESYGKVVTVPWYTTSSIGYTWSW
ncbi:MAG TPA: hypothetical protein VK724_18030 [Bryobacteraceae bacterium]|nr:hypothetical protein [Bryobacteraceae bacterium]